MLQKLLEKLLGQPQQQHGLRVQALEPTSSSLTLFEYLFDCEVFGDNK
jgi:hypothetical protein